MAMPTGLWPTGIAGPGMLVDVGIGMTVLAEVVTYTVEPSGLMATAAVGVPTLIELIDRSDQLLRRR